jgi:oligopeptide transport system substrate-binding protein
MKNKKINGLLVSLCLVMMFSCTKKVSVKENVLNIVVSQKIKGMDPIFAADLYSGNEIARVYEGLLEFHYLKRPYVLKPNLAAEMPKVSSDGLTYTFKIKKGVLFQDNKCFVKSNGKGRELKAKDFVFSIKRLADPKLQSTGWWLLKGKILGLDEWQARNAKKATVDYSEAVVGLKALDDYTLEFKLKKPFPQFLYALAMPFTFVVAQEAVNMYKKEFLNHPVGTGAFLLPKFKQTNKIVYIKNPTFREKFYPSEGEISDEKLGYLADRGKKIPFVDKVVVSILTESQPRWLNFQKGKFDFLGIPKDNFDQAVTPDKKISTKMQKKNIQLKTNTSLDVTYIAFNHEDKLFQNEKLRKAMSMGYDTEKAINLFYNGNAVPANSVVPPGISGYEKNYKNPYKKYDVSAAKKMLAQAGYPDGKGLPVIQFETTGNTTQRQLAEYFVKAMKDIGVKIKINTNTWPELVKKINTRSAQLWGIAWGADYPDAENFLQLLYGKNKAPGANGSNFQNKEFDSLFEAAAIMQDSPTRTAIYEKLNRMAASKMPWIFGVHRKSFVLNQGWLRNYKLTEFSHGQAKYLRVDNKSKKTILESL